METGGCREENDSWLAGRLVTASWHDGLPAGMNLFEETGHSDVCALLPVYNCPLTSSSRAGWGTASLSLRGAPTLLSRVQTSSRRKGTVPGTQGPLSRATQGCSWTPRRPSPHSSVGLASSPGPRALWDIRSSSQLTGTSYHPDFGWTGLGERLGVPRFGVGFQNMRRNQRFLPGVCVCLWICLRRNPSQPPERCESRGFALQNLQLVPSQVLQIILEMDIWRLLNLRLKNE